MSEYDTGNPVPSASMPDAWDNMQSIDKFVNSSDETITTRTGEQLDTLHGVNVKADNQLTQQQADFETSQEERDAVVEETRQNLIPLSRQYMTLAAAQADIANIPEGSTTYYRSPDDSALAIEAINNAGTLTATGRKMPAYSSLRRGNILFDAFNEYSAVDPKFGAWDWYRGATVTFSTTDANIPLPTPVAQYSGVWSADKYYDLARLPVRVGDQLTFSVLAWFQDAGAKFHIFWMSASGTIISSKSVTGLASGINVPVLTDIVPAGASYVRIRVENTTTGSFKVGAYASAVGSIQPEFIRAAPDKTYMSAIVSSGIAGLTSRVDALQGAISVGYPYAATWQVGKFVNPKICKPKYRGNNR